MDFCSLPLEQVRQPPSFLQGIESKFEERRRAELRLSAGGAPAPSLNRWTGRIHRAPELQILDPWHTV